MVIIRGIRVIRGGLVEIIKIISKKSAVYLVKFPGKRTICSSSPHSHWTWKFTIIDSLLILSLNTAIERLVLNFEI